MKVMVIVKASPESERGDLPSPELLTEMGKYNEELVKAGIMLAGEGLHPSSKGYRVRFSGTNRSVVNGPFAETTELIAGFWLWQVKSMEDALAWVKRCPNPMLSDSEIEVRQVFAPEDFAPVDPTGEILADEARLTKEIEKYTLPPPRFEQGRAMTVGGIIGYYTMGTRSDIPKQWEQFSPQIGKVPGQVGADSYGVCWNFKSDNAFDYLCGVEVDSADELPAGYTTVKVEPRKYAVFNHTKPIGAIGQTLEAIFCKWLPNSGLEGAQAPCFERYTKEFNPAGAPTGCEIWVPLKG